MALVAGVDSSTQSCKVVVRDADTGALVRQGRAAHPDATEVHPDAWWQALGTAIDAAGGLDDVAGVSVGAQQHGMVCLDEHGEVVRPALLWNDLRSAGAAQQLVDERGARFWAQAIGSVPVASFTITKLRWLAEHEPRAADRTHTVCLPHDWLTWRLAGGGDPATVTTDRSDASGTGYWSPATGRYLPDLLRDALRGRQPGVPEVLAPAQAAGHTKAGAVLGPGAGDNASACLGIGAAPGDVVISIGTSGTVFTSVPTPSADPTGIIAGFADATGRYLPLVCTMNAARVLEATAALLGVSVDELSRLALRAAPGAGGLTMVPYLEGERTPNRPHATGALHGMTLGALTPANLARAAVEGMLCALADGLDALLHAGVALRRVILVGGGVRSAAVRALAPTIFGVPVVVPPPSEYVADGAARQAAWVVSGDPEPPQWTIEGEQLLEADAVPLVRERYAEARGLVLDRAPSPDGSP